MYSLRWLRAFIRQRLNVTCSRVFNGIGIEGEDTEAGEGETGGEGLDGGCMKRRKKERCRGMLK